jgi:glycosyltransferase involved in cell wall biosynthesis
MITLCLTTYNRSQRLFEAFRQLINDERISEIVIVDDHSDLDYFLEVTEYCRNIPKIKLFRNSVNLDCYRNKREAIDKASNEWVIIGDSDNIFTPAYVDCITGRWSKLNKKQILQPEFAKPHFNFKTFSGWTIDRNDGERIVVDGNLQTMLNAMNYFVNRDEYLRVWDGDVDPVTADSIYQNYRWLAAGNSIYVCPGMEYEHPISSDSHYKQNVKRTPQGFYENILERIKNL